MSNPSIFCKQALDLGSLEFDKEAVEGNVVKVWQTTYPRFDKYVPSGVAKLAQRMIGNKLVYTDILSYDPQKLQRPPFEIGVNSIPPVFRNKVCSLLLWICNVEVAVGQHSIV